MGHPVGSEHHPVTKLIQTHEAMQSSTGLEIIRPALWLPGFWLALNAGRAKSPLLLHVVWLYRP